MTRWLVTTALALPGLGLLTAHALALRWGLPGHTAALTGMPADAADPMLGAVALVLGLTAPVFGPPLCAAALLHALWPRRRSPSSSPGSTSHPSEPAGAA